MKILPHVCTQQKQWTTLALFSGHLLLRSLDHIRDFWTTRSSTRRPGISSTSSNCKADSIMMYVDSVSVILWQRSHARYCTFLRVLLRSPRTNGSSFQVSYIVGFYGTVVDHQRRHAGMDLVVVGHYSSFIPSAWYAWVFKVYALPPHHCSAGI